MAYTYFRKNNDHFWNEPPDERSPERALLSAVLKQAVEDYTRGTLEESQDALDWISGQFCEDTKLTFDWLCQQLDFDPEKTAQAILSLPRTPRVPRPRRSQISVQPFPVVRT